MRVMRVGQRGPNVRKWQLFLIGQNCQPGSADGVFGPRTGQATMKFQRKYRLGADGVVGIRTLGQAMLLGYDALEDREDEAETGPNFPPAPDFKPLVGIRARQRVFGRFDYVSDPSDRNPERIKVLGDWRKENITRVELPQLKGVKGAPRTLRVTFHREAADQLVALWTAWDEAGLTGRVLTWAGTYVPRFIRGSRKTLSNHAFGTAFDINVAWNGLGMQPALMGKEGSVRELVPIANAHGFYWGGHFRKRPDGMHFEVAVV